MRGTFWRSAANKLIWFVSTSMLQPWIWVRDEYHKINGSMETFSVEYGFLLVSPPSPQEASTVQQSWSLFDVLEGRRYKLINTGVSSTTSVIGVGIIKPILDNQYRPVLNRDFGIDWLHWSGMIGSVASATRLLFSFRLHSRTRLNDVHTCRRSEGIAFSTQCRARIFFKLNAAGCGRMISSVTALPSAGAPNSVVFFLGG